MIQAQLEHVRAQIAASCRKAGRREQEVTLIAVSKTYPPAAIAEAINCGQLVFGENKVQELTDKIACFSEHNPPLSWHLIGHLQRNKVKYIIGKTTLIHSVDSLRLAQQIEQLSAAQNLISDILLEINVAGEETKFGLSPAEAEPLLRQLSLMPHLRVRGLMTIAPFVENPEDNRPIFRELHELLVDINTKNIDNIAMDTLSMGMTNDYSVAIEEGATMVRVGTGIFGVRDYARK